ncbi:MAG TPA: MFS transporter [Bacteroidales bacterium]|nr:MFS transporter [Bacteroidales bacterium]
MKKNTGIPKAVIMLGIVSLFTDAGTEMIYPLVPVFVAALGSGAVILGIIEGVAETTAAMLKLFSGIISDRVGKRKLFVLTGYTISSVFRPLTGIVGAAWQIIFIRMADRVGKGIRSAPRDALIAASTDETIRGKAYGFDRAMDHTGAVIGPLLAIIVLVTIISGFGIFDSLTALRWTFLFSVIPGTLAVLTVVFFVSEKAPARNNGGKLNLSIKDFDSNFRTYLLIMILFTLGNSSDAFLLFRVEEALKKSGTFVAYIRSIGPLDRMISGFGSPENQANIINILFLPVIWAFFHIIKVIFSTPLGALSDRIGRKKVISAGWAIYACVYLAFALLVFLPSRWQLLATFVLFGIYALFYAFSEGAEKAFVADIVKDERRGTAFGMFNFAVGLGALPASVIFGFLYAYGNKLWPGFGGTIAFGFGSILAMISMLLLSVLVREPVRNSSTG